MIPHPTNHSSLTSALLKSNKTWFSTKEAASIAGRSSQYIRDAIDKNRLLAYTPPSLYHGQRSAFQIHKDDLLKFLLSFSPSHFPPK